MTSEPLDSLAQSRSPARHRIKLIAWLLITALAMCDIGNMRTVLEGLGVPGTGLLYYVRHGYMPVAGLAFVLALSTPHLFKCLIPGVRRWMLGLMGLIVVLGLYGALRQNSMTVILFELSMFTVFFTAILLGGQKHLWSLLERYLIIQLVVSAVLTLVFFGMISGDLTGGSVARDLLRPDTETGSRALVAYKTTFMAASFPWLIFSINRRAGWSYVVIAVSLLVLFIGSILFAKRGTAAVFLLCTVIVFAWPGRDEVRVLSRSMLNRVVGYIVVLSLAWVLITNVMGGLGVVSTGADHLEERFSQIGGQERTSHEVAGMERLLEASFIIDDFNTIEMLVGRGLAGAYPVPYFWKLGSTVQESGTIVRGSSGTHIGAAFLFLKGGLILIFVFSFGWILVILRRVIPNRIKELRPHRLTLGVYLGSILTGIGFSLTGGSVLLVYVSGLCIGYCAARRPDDPWG